MSQRTIHSVDQLYFTHSAHLSVDDLKKLYERMVSEGLDKAVLYDGSIKCWQDWANFMLETKSWLVQCAWEDGTVVGMWWLNGFLGKTAMIHFCWFKNTTFNEKVEIGKQALKWLASLNILRSVFGLTPKPYRHVIPYLEATGFSNRGYLPGACYMARKNKYVDGVISVFDLSLYDDTKTCGGG